MEQWLSEAAGRRDREGKEILSGEEKLSAGGCALFELGGCGRQTKNVENARGS
jgi:hypothetical protein